MPELPEVETMCRGISPIVGRRIRGVSLPECHFRPIQVRPGISQIQQSLIGHRVERISRLGKRVVIHANGHALILQPKMSGLVLLEEPPDPDHNRLQIDFVGQPRLRLLFWDRRGLGVVEMLNESELHERVVAGRLGPDALEITFEEFCERIAATQRPIKVALLDQKLVAGIGNLYASEMLHQAKINPAEVSGTIAARRLRLLFAAMESILRNAIKQEGSTLSDGTYRNALNDPGNYQSQHLVYDRAGQKCLTCSRGEILRIVQAQRSTFYCPKCQREPAKSN